MQLDPYMVECDVYDPYSLGEKRVSIPMYLPHELFASTWAAGCFETLFCGGDGEVEKFWDSVKGSEWAQHHPAYLNPDLLKWTIPVRWHGDDAAMKSLQNTKLCIVSLHGELCRLPSIQSRLLSFVVKDKSLVTGTTLRQLFEVFAWSLGIAFGKYWPRADHRGMPFQVAHGSNPGAERHRRQGTLIAGPWRFAFVGALGDMAWHDKVYQPVLNSWRYNFCCFRCCASKVLPQLAYMDFSQDLQQLKTQNTGATVPGPILPRWEVHGKFPYMAASLYPLQHSSPPIF